MKLRSVYLVLCVAALLTLGFLASAYQSHAASIDPPAPSAPSAPAAPAPAAHKIRLPLVSGKPVVDNSLNVTPAPDAGRAVSATIPLAGGQITAVAANNTRFTLTIPDKSLVQTTTVTLTPLAQIAGLPNVQLVGAVQIEPAGVTLLEGALLKIEPAQTVPVAQEYPFAYYANGKDFHPYPIKPYDPGLVYPLGAIDGGYGIARKVTSAAAASEPPFTPLDPEARMRAQMTALIQIERERLLGGQEPDPTLWPKVRDLTLEYYNTIIKPTLQPSMNDCTYAKAHIGDAVGWLRQVMLLFGDSAETDPELSAAGEAIWDALIKAIKNCYHEAATPCVNWDNPQQVHDVLAYYRELMLLGAEAGEISPFHLPECTIVDVTLSGGQFHYTFPPNVWGLWDRAVIFQFPDDSVSGVGWYQPFYPKGSPLPGASAIISMTAMIDGVWQPVPLGKYGFCRDKVAERVQELMISYADVEGEPKLPPQLFADNIGCWKWTGSVRHDIDYTNIPGVPEFYQHTSGQLTLEAKTDSPYVTYASQGKVTATQTEYRLVAPSSVNYDDKLVHRDSEGTTCIQTLTANITNPWTFASPNYDGMTLPNAGFGRERKVGGGLELLVNLPYNAQGTTCPFAGQSLDRIGVPVEGDLSADGRHIQYSGSGPTGEGTGTWTQVVNLTALRQ